VRKKRNGHKQNKAMSHSYKYVTGHTFQNGVVKNVWDKKEFQTKGDLIKYLVENKDEIIGQKKSIDKHCEGGISITGIDIITSNKASSALYENDKEAGILKRTILANTYWWMDSQSDVLLGRGDGDNSVFSTSIKQTLGSKKGADKVPPIDQHNYSLDGRIGKTLSLYEAPISWRALGVGKTGMTEGLFAEAEIHKSLNEKRYNDYLNDMIDQHSVGMKYINLQLAVDNEQEYPKEYALWQKFIGKIGNRQQVEDQGYFFPVFEGILREYSAVIAGANELTPVIGQSHSGTGKNDTSTIEDSRKKEQDLRNALLKLSSTILN